MGGRGQRFVAKDAKVHYFISKKARSLYHRKIKPVKLRWTQAWRRMNKKGKVDESGKKRTRKVQKFQKAIVGMTLDDIKKKKAQKPELRQAAKEAAGSGAKPKNAAKPKAAGGKDAKTGGKDAKIGTKNNAKSAGGKDAARMQNR